ncbi:hypothetical protein REPUB_Repub04eG0093700 [Reevesia pubescens]
MGRSKNMRKKEEIAEDFRFFCKDDGLLRVCDYKNCLTSFHPHCVGSDNSVLETEERWVCGWHFCFNYRKPAKFHCFCCQSAACGRCLYDAEFIVVKGRMGFCNTCLEFALLIEDKKDVNSNGTPSEQSRLIHEIPEVVADVAGPEPAFEDSPREDKEEQEASSESALRSISRIRTSIPENNGVSCCQNVGMDAAAIPEGKQQHAKPFTSDDHCHHSKFIDARVEGDETQRNQFFLEVKPNCPGTSVPRLQPQESSDGQTNPIYQEKQHSDAAGEKLNQPLDIGEHVKVESHVEVIVLSDDEMQDASPRAAVSQLTFEDQDCSIWYCISPPGNIKGPYSMKVLKRWSKSSSGHLQFKVLKSGQRQEEAVLLTDAIRQNFNS